GDTVVSPLRKDARDQQSLPLPFRAAGGAFAGAAIRRGISAAFAYAWAIFAAQIAEPARCPGDGRCGRAARYGPHHADGCFDVAGAAWLGESPSRSGGPPQPASRSHAGRRGAAHQSLPDLERRPWNDRGGMPRCNAPARGTRTARALRPELGQMSTP